MIWEWKQRIVDLVLIGRLGESSAATLSVHGRMIGYMSILTAVVGAPANDSLLRVILIENSQVTSAVNVECT